MTANEARPGRPTRAEWLAFATVIALAAVVRLARPDLTEFKACLLYTSRTAPNPRRVARRPASQKPCVAICAPLVNR